MLTITFCLEDGPKRYSKAQIMFKINSLQIKIFFFNICTFSSPSNYKNATSVCILLDNRNCSPTTAIGRTLIPRYFRSIFEGGATELYYVLKHPKESFHNNFVSLDCDQCTMVTQNGKPMFTQVGKAP